MYARTVLDKKTIYFETEISKIFSFLRFFSY